MACLHRRARLLLGLLAGVLVMLGTSSCSRLGQSNEQAKVIHAFDSWKKAMLNHHTDQAMAYVPRQVDDYLAALNATPGKTAPATATALSASPGVDLLLRQALEKKVPVDFRSHLTLGALLKRITDRNLVSPHSLQDIVLGQVWVNGDHANAEVYYQGTLTALRMPFLKEHSAWKIDVMALLPYAEVLMRVDRAVKGQTVTEQVDQLVSRLPSL